MPAPHYRPLSGGAARTDRSQERRGRGSCRLITPCFGRGVGLVGCGDDGGDRGSCGGGVRRVAPASERAARGTFPGGGGAGRGGIRSVAGMTGAAESTVSRGVRELESRAAPSARVRTAGAGRRRLRDGDPGLVDALMALVEPDQRGDPESPLRWT